MFQTGIVSLLPGLLLLAFHAAPPSGTAGAPYAERLAMGPGGDGTHQNLATGFCLDSNAARQVYTMSCNGGSYQKWRLLVNGDGTQTYQNLATGFCLDSNAARQVYAMSCNGGSYQKWR